MQTVLIDSFKTDDLGRNKPCTATMEITARVHDALWYLFSPHDVWTADGWLITAVQKDHVTWHVRKGQNAGRCTLTSDTKLYCNPLKGQSKKDYEMLLQVMQNKA